MLTFLVFIFNFLGRYKAFKKLLNVEKDIEIVRLPKLFHEVVDSLPEKVTRILFVGDVHGCFDELCELLEVFEVGKYPDETFIVFTGDIVNKGPKNVETLQFVRSLGQMAVSVRGNHEQAVLYRLEKRKETNILVQKYSWITGLSTEDEKYLEELPFTITFPFLNVIVVHGGMVPGVKLQDQSPCNMLNMRNYITEEQTGTPDIDIGLPWGSQWYGPQFVIFGHDARRLLQRYKYSLGLDTGCLYGGNLTGFLVNLNEKFPMQNGILKSVPAYKAYVQP